jgi:hypothetical protein
MPAQPLRDTNSSEGGTPFDAAAVLRALAQPRLTGSAGAAAVTTAVRALFEDAGYDVEEHPFRFNPLPGRFGITAAGVLYLITSFAAAMLLYTNHPFGALALLIILLVVIGLAVMFATTAIQALPWGCQHGSNLFAFAAARPRYIVMAHRDSKSQPVPLAFRGPAVIIAVVAWLALFIAAVFHTAQPLPGGLIIVIGVAAVLAGVTLVFCWVDNNSPGALDNASGVAAAVGIARREQAHGDVAFLITDAEELGLAGARAAAGHLPAVYGVINMDGLDDVGSFYVFERFGILRKRGLAPHLAVALLQAAEAAGERIERRDLPFGIPVDHIPIVRAGTTAVTLMRGTLHSLRRVHSAQDDLEHLSGDGVTRAVDLVCGALQRLREQAHALER